jgi:hypothetical protein
LRSSRATRGISALRAAQIPRLGLGMTPLCHPERTRGISALRKVEIPRLRLGMTIWGVAARNDNGSVAARNGEAKPGWNGAGLSSRANARDLGVAKGGDSSPAARNDNWGIAARNDNWGVAARNHKGGVAARNGEAKPGWNDAGLSSRANARDLRVARGGDSSPAARNDNWGLRLGMTIGGLRLGMTMAALPLGMTMAALRL